MSAGADSSAGPRGIDPAGSSPVAGALRSPRARAIACAALAVPLLGSAANYVFGFIEPPEGDEFLGSVMWRLMREGGLFLWVVLGHTVTGAMLLLPRWRFAGALLQLPISLGIAAFNLTMFPPGVGAALVMLALNLVAVADPDRLTALLGEPATRARSAPHFDRLDILQSSDHDRHA